MAKQNAQKKLNFFEVCKYLDEGNPLYLRNTSIRSNGTMNVIIIDYLTQEGGRGFNFPRTTLPLNICNHIDASALKQSNAFKRLYNKGVLEMVSEEEAQKELSDDTAKESLDAAINEADNHGITQLRAQDVEKARKDERDFKAAQEAEKAQGMQHIMTSLDPQLAQLLESAKKQKSVEEEKLGNPRFMALEAKCRSMDADTQYKAFVGIYGELDVETLMKVATNSTWSKKVRDAAKKRMNDLMD